MRLREVLGSLAAPARLRARGWALLALYLAAAATLLGLVAGFALTHERDAVDWLARYLFPASWRVPARMLVEGFLRRQEEAVLVNAVVSGSLILVSLLLFPLKEKLSATFEREARLTAEPGGGFPLLFEAREEIKLFLFFVAAQSSIFWLGYTPDPGRRAAAVALSYVAMAAAFAMDFLTPILQRHQVRFSTAAKALALRPIAALAFGAIFSLPVSLAGALVTGGQVGRTVAIVFAVNVVAIGWAAVSGTQAGARLLPAAQATPRPSAATRAIAWILLAALLGWNGYRFGAVGLALHRKSAILKCSYDVDWKSARFEMRSLLEVALSLDVTITNPTDRTVAIEKNRLELSHRGTRIAETSLPVLEVPAGGKTSTRATFGLALSPSAIVKGRELVGKEGYALTLWLDVAPGFELPLYLFGG